MYDDLDDSKRSCRTIVLLIKNLLFDYFLVAVPLPSRGLLKLPITLGIRHSWAHCPSSTLAQKTRFLQTEAYHLGDMLLLETINL